MISKSLEGIACAGAFGLVGNYVHLDFHFCIVFEFIFVFRLDHRWG